MLAVLLVGVAFISSRDIRKGEFHLGNDEPTHAFTGVYFADLMYDAPWSEPVDYTYRYYAQYPALGLLHWPPVFHAVEGVGFYLFGPSVETARGTVLLFALLAIVFLFLIVREVHGTPLAAGAALLFAFLPSVRLFEKVVMLEMPAMALSLGAVWAWLGFLRSGARGRLYGFALLSALALLTKQQTIFLLPFCLFTVWTQRRLDVLRDPHVYAALALVFVLVTPFYALAFSLHFETVVADVFRGSTHVAHPFTYYARILPLHLGWPVVVLSAAGFIVGVRGRGSMTFAMLCLLAASYVVMTAMAQKAPRHILYALPVFAYLAVVPLTRSALPAPLRWGYAALLVPVVAMYGLFTWRQERPYLAGYAPAAQDLTREADSSVVLFDGDLGANFIFFLRAFDESRDLVVVRKALYASRIVQAYGKEEFVRDEAELERALDEYGVRYIVIENGLRLRYEAQAILREYVKTGNVKLLGIYPVEGTARPRPESLSVYEYVKAKPPGSDRLRVPMLTLSHDIEVDFASLLRPKPTTIVDRRNPLPPGHRAGHPGGHPFERRSAEES